MALGSRIVHNPGAKSHHDERLRTRRNVPPRSCFIDGVQFSSGCTTGKGNIVITVGENVSVLFERKGRKVLVRVNPQFLGSLKNLGSEEELEGLSRDLMDRTDDDLFLIQEM